MYDMINKFKHWVAHLLHLNEGDVISWREGDKIFISFKCKGCGKTLPPTEYIHLPKEPNYDDINS